MTIRVLTRLRTYCTALTNTDCLYMHPSTDCELSYLTFSNCLVIVYFLFSTTDLVKEFKKMKAAVNNTAGKC